MTKIKIAVSAEQLSGAHISALAYFDWKFPSGVQATVCGELRQIYHTSSETVLNLAGVGTQSDVLTEFTLDKATRVEIEA